MKGVGPACRPRAIVWQVLPLATSSSAYAIISGTVVGALLLFAWLLRRDEREEAAEGRQDDGTGPPVRRP